MRKALVVLNRRSGALLGRDVAVVRREVEERLADAGRAVDVVLAKGREIRHHIDAGASGPYDTLIVGGGDGSISYAVQKLAGTDKVLGALPLGTMNLLAHDIGLPLDLSDAVQAVATAEPVRIDLGTLNGRPFHTLSGVGFFSQMARAREETRDIPGKLLRTVAAFVRALRRTGRFTLDLEVDGRPQRIDSVAALVTVNCMTRDGWRRECLDGGHLEIHVAEDAGALGLIKAGADLFTGAWRDNPGIHSFKARELRIAPLRHRTWVATDGELAREHAPLYYAVRPRALNLLVPKAAKPG